MYHFFSLYNSSTAQACGQAFRCQIEKTKTTNKKRFSFSCANEACASLESQLFLQTSFLELKPWKLGQFCPGWWRGMRGELFFCFWQFCATWYTPFSQTKFWQERLIALKNHTNTVCLGHSLPWTFFFLPDEIPGCTGITYPSERPAWSCLGVSTHGSLPKPQQKFRLSHCRLGF